MRYEDGVIRDIVEWDVGNWSRALAFWERHCDLTSHRMHCLELGARRGGVSLWLALKGHSVVCSDLQDNRATAEPLHVKYGVSDRIMYQAIDATAIPYENEFDVVAFKSVLGGVGWNGDIARQQAAVDSIYRSLKPGGILLFAENLRGSPMHSVLRQRFVKWNSVWRYVTLAEMLSFLRKFSDVQYGTTGFLGLLGRGQRDSAMLSKIDAAVWDHVIPPQWRYISFGVAKK